MRNMAVTVWLILATIWGSTWLFIKLGLDDNIPPFTLMYTRFLVAGVLLGLISLSRLRHLPKDGKTWLLIVLTGNMLFTVNYSLVYWGEMHISSALAAIVYTTLPLLGGPLAHWMLPDERLSRAKMTGAVMGIAGVAVIFSGQLELSGVMAPWGVAAILVAVVCTATSSNLVKLHLRGVDPIILTGGQLCAAIPPMVCLGLLTEGSPIAVEWTTLGMVSVVYLGALGTALTFGLLNWLYRHMDVTKTQLIPLASTLIAVFLGWLVRGETLGWRTVLGAVIIISGLIVAGRSRRP